MTLKSLKLKTIPILSYLNAINVYNRKYFCYEVTMKIYPLKYGKIYRSVNKFTIKESFTEK